MCNRTAYENAGRVLPSLTGPALWVWTRGVAYCHQIPAALRDRASFASVVIPRCPAMEASIDQLDAAAWYTPDGEGSPGSRAVQALAHEVLTRLDIPLAPATSLPLGPRPTGPYPSLRDFRAREEQARPPARGVLRPPQGSGLRRHESRTTSIDSSTAGARR
jgi:hypothetical protein